MDARSVTPADLDRFRKMLGMLGSDHAGERSAAALKCSSWLRDRGLTWSSVSLPVVVEAEVEPNPEEILKRRRESMGGGTWQNAQAERDLKAAMSEFEKAVRNHKAAKKAAWKERSYGADENGFETGRK